MDHPLRHDELALDLSHTLHDRQDEWLSGFADRVRRQWREIFALYMPGEQVDGMIADAVERVRKRRDEIEVVGAGSA